MISNPILSGPGAFDGDEEFIALRTSLGFSFGHDQVLSILSLLVGLAGLWGLVEYTCSACICKTFG